MVWIFVDKRLYCGIIIIFHMIYFYLSDLIIAVWIKTFKFLGTLSTSSQITRDRDMPTSVYAIHIQLFVVFNTGN